MNRSTAILAVGQAGILPAERRLSRRDACWAHRLEACVPALAASLTAIVLSLSPPCLLAESVTFESGDSQNTLIELFTSEGCSSCPPAEKWLSALKSKQELWKKIVPVAFHVDYWDRLGWRDRFAKPEFTSRQQRYAAAWGGDSVYTPGFVVNGKEWQGWFGGNAVPTISTRVGVLHVSLDNNGKLTTTFVPDTAKPRALLFNVALLGNELESDVKRGENSGRKLRHDFVVLDLITINARNESKRWIGSTVLPIQSSTDKPAAIAVWITEDGTPIQATGGWLQR